MYVIPLLKNSRIYLIHDLQILVIVWHLLWLSTTEGKNIVKLLAIGQTRQFHGVIFNV